MHSVLARLTTSKEPSLTISTLHAAAALRSLPAHMLVKCGCKNNCDTRRCDCKSKVITEAQTNAPSIQGGSAHAPRHGRTKQPVERGTRACCGAICWMQCRIDHPESASNTSRHNVMIVVGRRQYPSSRQNPPVVLLLRVWRSYAFSPLAAREEIK